MKSTHRTGLVGSS